MQDGGVHGGGVRGAGWWGVGLQKTMKDIRRLIINQCKNQFFRINYINVT